jgi:protein TonB
MPHARYWISGLTFSAALHAGVFFGLPNDKPPVDGAKPPPRDEIPVCTLTAPIEPDPLPPPEAGEETKPATESTNSNAEFRRLEEPISGTRPSIVMENIPLEPAVIPDPNKMIQGLPTAPDTGHRRGREAAPIRGIDLDKQPEATLAVAPQYPFALEASGVTGKVMLRFVVTAQGEVRDIAVLSATHPEFGRAASAALERWRFKAGIKGGHRVASIVELPFVFSADH